MKPSWNIVQCDFVNIVQSLGDFLVVQCTLQGLCAYNYTFVILTDFKMVHIYCRCMILYVTVQDFLKGLSFCMSRVISKKLH